MRTVIRYGFQARVAYSRWGCTSVDLIVAGLDHLHVKLYNKPTSLLDLVVMFVLQCALTT